MASKTVGSLTLDSLLEDCEVGVQKTISLTVTPTRNDEGGFAADVTEVEDYEESETEDREEKPTGKKSDSKDLPSHVVMIGIGKK